MPTHFIFQGILEDIKESGLVRLRDLSAVFVLPS